MFGYTEDGTPITNPHEFAAALKRPERVVGRDSIELENGSIAIWTTHLVTDSNWTGEGPPLTYETLVQCSGDMPEPVALFDGVRNQYPNREMARQGHAGMVQAITAVIAARHELSQDPGDMDEAGRAGR